MDDIDFLHNDGLNALGKLVIVLPSMYLKKHPPSVAMPSL